MLSAKGTADEIGGSNKSAAGWSVTVNLASGETAETDIDGEKTIFRERAAVRRFFERVKPREGDSLLLERTAERHFRVSLALGDPAYLPFALLAGKFLLYLVRVRVDWSIDGASGAYPSSAIEHVPVFTQEFSLPACRGLWLASSVMPQPPGGLCHCDTAVPIE